jgi:purine-cytosine permease-like protein
MELCLKTWMVLERDIGNWVLINLVSWLFLMVALVALVVLVGLEALLVVEVKVVVLVVVLVEIVTGPSFHGNDELSVLLICSAFTLMCFYFFLVHAA